ncbi:MAG: sterol desaturase family protein [Candidatus Omnitrophica bacterium]|nr:sterol desaturase family protein [Candidatus Omnitrophota bacterium]
MDKQLFLAIFLIIGIFLAEGWFPFFKRPSKKKRLKHTGINMIFGIGNGIITKILFTVSTVWVVRWAADHGAGLLRVITFPLFMQGVIAFLLFDLWMYWWHRFNHEYKFLWNFHSMHHTDTEMDASTAFRFHPVEKIISALLMLLVFVSLGMDLISFSIYSFVVSPIILFHHSNIALSDPIDRFFRHFIVTPNMHRVHHSKKRPETDSNYSTVFSVWDRIFGTYKEVDDYRAIVFGLEKMRQPKWHTVKGMLWTPLYTAGILKEG